MACPMSLSTLSEITPTTFVGWSLTALVDDLLASEEAKRDGKTARTLVKSRALTVVLTVLRAGETIHEHRAPAPTTVVPLCGDVTFVHRDTQRRVSSDDGSVLVMGPDAAHRVEARRDSAFLLIFGAR